MDPSPFISDPVALEASLSGAGMTQKEGSVLGKGTKEINESWLSKLKGAAQDDDSASCEEEDLPQVSEKEETLVLAKEEKPKIKNQKKPKGPMGSKKRNVGSSAQEKKALGEYLDEGHKTDDQIEAFLVGFRMKQDYTLVTMRAQMEQLQKLVDVLTSATTSISRASCDIVESTTSASAKLAMSVTSSIEKVKEKDPEKVNDKNQKTPFKKPISSAPEMSRKVENEIERVEKSNKEEIKRIKKTEENKRKTEIAKAVVTVQSDPITVEDLEKIMGMTCQGIKKFYGVDEGLLSTMLKDIPGPMNKMVERSGGLVSAKGKIKKMLSALSS